MNCNSNRKSDFGYNLKSTTCYIRLTQTQQLRFLTNAPTTQYANVGDYGTLAFLVPTSFTANNASDKIELNYFNASMHTSWICSLGSETIN